MASDVIDIYMGDYNSCIEFGRRQAGIYVIAESYNE
jgi:3D (Asp-Asp-Asp) domain-containing protein